MEQKLSLEQILTEVEQDVTLAGEKRTSEATPAEAEQIPQGEQETVGLGALFSQPELMLKLPGLLQVVKSLTEPPAKEHPAKPASPVNLLTALRPYLNDQRRQALDTMIKVSRLSESLKSLK